ncbi:hypothetical protein IJ425_03420 [bacterium]|nr:hypothetical protein [bacterium]
MLKILQINYGGIRTLPQTRKASNPIFKQKQDVFTKNNNVSFKGNNSSFFEKMAQEYNFQVEDVKDIINKENNMIGSGNKHTSFAIPNCDDYILRIDTFNLPFVKNADFSSATTKDFEDENLGINIGQKVASIEVMSLFPYPLEIEILKKQQGESIGVQPPESLYIENTGCLKPNTLPYEDYSRKEKYARTIHKVSQLPVESFETLLQELKIANEAGYVFDHLNSNNLLVDEENQRINIIDMEKGSIIVDPIADLFYALTNISYLKTYMAQYTNPTSEEERNKVIEDTITIIQKFTQAMQNQGMKFEKDNISLQADDVFRSYPCAAAFMARNKEEVWNALSQMGIAQ